MPYHLRDRKEELIHEMISQDVIEEYANSEPLQCTANCVLLPKNDESIFITLDA